MKEYNEHDMCVERAEVKELTDQLQREMHHEFKSLREERDTRMREIAVSEINIAKDSMMRFIGWGGIVGIGMFVYFFGGLTGDVNYIAQEQTELKQSMSELEKFMNAGDRFTGDDGLELKAYVDQQDDYILRRVDDGFDSLSKQITRLHEE